jgi:hypothetical protein
MFRQIWRGLAVLVAAVLTMAVVIDGSASGHKNAGIKSRVAGIHEIPLKATAQLRLFKNTQSIHEAKGQASGTLGGSIFLRINVETASRMTANYVGKSGSSSLFGKGTVKYTVSGSTLHFVGTSSIVQGTGKYKNAYGNGIHLEGTMNRLTERITMFVRGNFYT